MSKEKELLKRVRDTLRELKETYYDLYWDIQAVLDQPEQEPSVKLPESEDEAAMMNLLSDNWLRHHAPHRLNQPEQEPVTCSLLSDQYIEDKSPSYDMTIHDNPDALAWARFFRETNPDCNVDDNTMFGWFANAMMAMHDHTLRNYAPPKREPLSFDDLNTMWCGNPIDFARRIESIHGIGVADE